MGHMAERRVRKNLTRRPAWQGMPRWCGGWRISPAVLSCHSISRSEAACDLPLNTVLHRPGLRRHEGGRGKFAVPPGQQILSHNRELQVLIRVPAEACIHDRVTGNVQI